MNESTEPDPAEFADPEEFAEAVDPEEFAEAVDPEEFAEAVGVDPTPQQVDEYQELLEENAPEPPPDPVADPG